ncbi:WhiB family transcriptional regulator [Acidimicrobiia bacterium EGI L10123]|nr:WhiB family transcriptional regulator [Acidimicrobiia bacterium EGI L10123]
MALGACRGADPDLFFPDRGESLEPAKRICSECVVRDECLEHALASGERFGVWGGTSERERRRIRRSRRTAAA